MNHENSQKLEVMSHQINDTEFRENSCIRGILNRVSQLFKM